MSTGTGDLVPVTPRPFLPWSRFPAWLLILLLVGAFVLYSMLSSERYTATLQFLLLGVQMILSRS